jgi:misacylated tRNA(Ala) deacylase
MTELLFRNDAYLTSCRAQVLEHLDNGVVLDRTVFYPQGGGQPGDAGFAEGPGGTRNAIANTIYAPDRTRILHLFASNEALPAPGDQIRLELDWERRFAFMRIHTALHLLSVVLPFPVTGGSIGQGEGRLDFDIPEGGLDREELTQRLMELVRRDAPVRERWITDEELDANPGLVKTMSVQPPRGAGRVRLVEIEGIDLQPCGGTHVRSTGEIGAVAVTDIEKKGRQNRRVRIRLV